MLSKLTALHKQQMTEMRDHIMNEISGMRGEMSGMRDEISGMRCELSGMRDEISGMRGEISGINGEISGMKAQMDVFNNRIINIESRPASKLKSSKNLKGSSSNTDVVYLIIRV